jgi:hypothetical protein
MAIGFLPRIPEHRSRPIIVEIQTGYVIPLSGVYVSTDGHEQRFDAGTRATADLTGNSTRWSFLRP